MGVFSVKGLSLPGLAWLMVWAGPMALAAEPDAAASGAGSTNPAPGMESAQTAPTAVTTPLPQLESLDCDKAGEDPIYSRLCAKEPLKALHAKLRELYAGLAGKAVPAGVNLATEFSAWQARLVITSYSIHYTKLYERLLTAFSAEFTRFHGMHSHPAIAFCVITSYSIHYTKLYESSICCPGAKYP